MTTTVYIKQNICSVLIISSIYQTTLILRVVSNLEYPFQVPGVKPEEVAGLFPKGITIHDVPSGKQYLRTTPQPE